MRISLPSRARGFALELLAVLVGVMFALALPSGARAAEACPNEQLRQESNVNPSTGEPYSTELPACRAYERVSPLLKAGSNVETTASYTSVAGDGDRITYDSFVGSFSEPAGFEIINPYLAQRSALGWVTHSAAAQASIIPLSGSFLKTLNTPELSETVLCGSPGESVGQIAVAELLCAARGTDGTWRTATPTFPQVGTTISGSLPTGITGASRDLSHVVFNLYTGNTVAHLLPEDTTVSVNGGSLSGLYEISGVGTSEASLRLVNVNNNGEQIGTAPPKLGNVQRESSKGRSLHAVSGDGSTVYFEATPTGGVQVVYARINGLYTVAISKPTVADCAECQTSFSTQLPAEFQGASADGSKVFFTTEQELFAGKTGNNLYEYDFDAAAGQRVTLVSRGASNAAVQGVVANSDDGSHIYFVATGALTSIANAGGQHATVGADNLYVFERDPAHPVGNVGFIGMRCSGKQLSGAVLDTQCPTSSTDQALWVASSEGGRDATTPDGRYLVFDTYAHLLTEDTNASQAIYRYDSQTGELSWVSHGVPNFTAPSAGVAAVIPASLPGTPATGALPDVSGRARTMSDDGSDVVFATKEALSPQSIAAKTGVYLWHEGTVSLISDAESLFLPEVPVISGSGQDVFFVTRDDLVTQDNDGLGDLYDARVDGGFPALSKVVECAAEVSGQDRGEACQGKPSSASLFGVPASVSFTGGANLSSPMSTASSGALKSKSQPKQKQMTRAQKLTQALKTCRKVKAKKKRVTCEKQARKKYGGKAKKTSNSGRGR